MMDVDGTARDLDREKLVDRGRLKPGGRAEVRASMERWYAQQKLRAYVLLLPAGEPIEPTRTLWDKLGLDAKRDLLLVSNGHDWEARGWGLAPARIEQALAEAAPARRQYFGKGISVALDNLGTAAMGASSAPTTAIAMGGVGALLVGGLAFVVHRRTRRARERKAAYDDVRTSAERAFADLVLFCEDLAGDDAARLQLAAADIKKQLDELVAETSGREEKMSNRVVLGKMRHLESELAALRSTALQKQKEIACSDRESSSTSPAQRPPEEWDSPNGSDLSSEQVSTSGAEKKS